MAFLASCGRLVILGLAPVAAGAAEPALQRFTFDDWLLAPVRIHLLSASNAPAIHTKLSEADLRRILGKMNGIWSQAGITFWPESVRREESVNQDYAATMGKAEDLRGLLSLRPPASQTTNLFHLYYVHQFSVNGVYLGPAMFVKDSASLRPVPGGIDEPLPRVSSHELGHALTLAHCTNTSHLMARGTTGTNFDTVEIEKARSAAKKLPWIEPATAVFATAEAAERRKDAAGAGALFGRIARIPLADRRVVRARNSAASRGTDSGAALYDPDPEHLWNRLFD